MKYSSKVKGFTLIELIIVIAIIAILMAVVLVALNPAKRFADSRNARRQSDISSIVAAFSRYTIDQALSGLTVNYIGMTTGGTAANPTLIAACSSPTVPLIVGTASVALAAGGLSTIPRDPTTANGYYDVCAANATGTPLSSSQVQVSTSHMESGATNPYSQVSQ